MKRNKFIESGNQKIMNALKEAISSGTHDVCVKLTKQEHKAVLKRMHADLAKPRYISKVS